MPIVSALMRVRSILAAALLVAGCARTGSGGGPAASVAAPSESPMATVEATHGHLAARDAVLAEAAAYPDDFCGRYLNAGFRPDLPGGAFVSMWRANLGTHEAHIRAMADGSQTMVFVGCTFPKADLEALMDALNADRSNWMAAIPAVATSWGVNEWANRIEMEISSTVPDAAAQVLAHYTQAFGLPAGILSVESDGNGAALRPWGTVRITALGPDGKPVHGGNNLYLEWTGDLPNLYCGVGDMGYGFSTDGSPTKLPCQAGSWWISIDTGPPSTVLGSGTVTVSGGQTVDLTIKLSAVPSPRP